jgi:Fur family ferric uptake transcriptional regulator
VRSAVIRAASPCEGDRHRHRNAAHSHPRTGSAGPTGTVTAPHNGPLLDAAHVDAALSTMRARGLRASSARRLVLEVLFAAEEPVCAERIASGLEGRLPRSDLASVYRNLETLEAVGLVRHFHLGHGPGLYAPAGEEREYLVCDACGHVRSVEPARLDPLREWIEGHFGLDASFGHFPIVGLCRRCSGNGLADGDAA